MELPDIRPEERTPLVETLLATLRQVLDRVGELEATNQQLRDEIAVLKGQKPRPQMRPSILSGPAPTTAGPDRAERRGRMPEAPLRTDVVRGDLRSRRSLGGALREAMHRIGAPLPSSGGAGSTQVALARERLRLASERGPKDRARTPRESRSAATVLRSKASRPRGCSPHAAPPTARSADANWRHRDRVAQGARRAARATMDHGRKERGTRS